MAHGLIPASMLKFETVAVVVRDEKKATKFWKDKLGFRVVTSFPHWVTVAPRGSNVRLHLCPDSPGEGEHGIPILHEGRQGRGGETPQERGQDLTGHEEGGVGHDAPISRSGWERISGHRRLGASRRLGD